MFDTNFAVYKAEFASRFTRLVNNTIWKLNRLGCTNLKNTLATKKKLKDSGNNDPARFILLGFLYKSGGVTGNEKEDEAIVRKVLTRTLITLLEGNTEQIKRLLVILDNFAFPRLKRTVNVTN